MCCLLALVGGGLSLFLCLQKVLYYLSQSDVDVEVLDCNGDMPLHAFVRGSKLECLFAFLINAEYDVDALNSSTETALHLACKVMISLNKRYLLCVCDVSKCVCI